MAITCVIPARLNASRFPKKLLVPVNGKPVICHTIQTALRASCFTKVYCLTDSVEIQDAVSDTDVETILTGPAANGTERIANALPQLKGDIFVNLQGDEPFFPLKSLVHFTSALESTESDAQIMVHFSEENPSDWQNQNRVKVILNAENHVLDFTRTFPTKGFLCETYPLPPETLKLAFQSGIYGYTRHFLEKYHATQPSLREQNESHEMLRILPLPKISALISHEATQSLDAPEDLDAIFSHFLSSQHRPVTQ